MIALIQKQLLSIPCNHLAMCPIIEVIPQVILDFHLKHMIRIDRLGDQQVLVVMGESQLAARFLVGVTHTFEVEVGKRRVIFDVRVQQEVVIRLAKCFSQNLEVLLQLFVFEDIGG
jgi:hypothetical protein